MDDKNERVRTGEADTPDYIDQSCWIPQGEEVVPAQILLNGHAASLGKHYTAIDSPFIDKLLAAGRIEGSHHQTALRLLHLFKLGTSKQDYAVMQIFMPSRGYDHSDFCPISVFIKVTRNLKMVYMYWIRVICGLESCSYGALSQNSDLLRDALIKVEENFVAYEDDLRDKEDAMNKGREYAEA